MNTWTKVDIETALSKGHVWIAMNNGSYWRCRRNGKTRLWLREPGRFRIPIKYGMSGYGEITQDSLHPSELVISETKPTSWKVR